MPSRHRSYWIRPVQHTHASKPSGRHAEKENKKKKKRTRQQKKEGNWTNEKIKEILTYTENTNTQQDQRRDEKYPKPEATWTRTKVLPGKYREDATGNTKNNKRNGKDHQEQARNTPRKWPGRRWWRKFLPWLYSIQKRNYENSKQKWQIPQGGELPQLSIERTLFVVLCGMYHSVVTFENNRLLLRPHGWYRYNRYIVILLRQSSTPPELLEPVLGSRTAFVPMSWCESNNRVVCKATPVCTANSLA